MSLILIPARQPMCCDACTYCATHPCRNPYRHHVLPCEAITDDEYDRVRLEPEMTWLVAPAQRKLPRKPGETRAILSDYLQHHGPATVEQLAHALDMTLVTVRSVLSRACRAGEFHSAVYQRQGNCKVYWVHPIDNHLLETVKRNLDVKEPSRGH